MSIVMTDRLAAGRVGIVQAAAGDCAWVRADGETERAFLCRARREAAAAGFRRVQIAGEIDAVAEVVPIRSVPSPGVA